MPKIRYETYNFKPETLRIIEEANRIINAYRAQGFDLTLRQLYYQFVSRDLIPNNQKSYDRLGDTLSKGRRAGLVDWDAIVDRTRNLEVLSSWASPESILSAVAAQFRYDPWLVQPTYVEVWFEKDALAGVFGRVCDEWRVPYFSCRGYTSDSELWRAAQRFRAAGRSGRDVVVLHFGDHDPSGIDMTRDIGDRFALFGATVDVRRLALNMDQVEQYRPPPNPAKTTDSRFESYLREYGDESWELDALEPTVMGNLVSDAVRELIEWGAWDDEMRRERRAVAELEVISQRYPSVTERLRAKIDERIAEKARDAGEDEDDEE